MIRLTRPWRGMVVAMLVAAGLIGVGNGQSKASSLTVYVSPLGSDANPGTMSLPVQTVARAAILAREAEAATHGSVTVLLAGGTYRLARPLDLGVDDSGSLGGHITWTAAPGQQPIISGAVQITDWRVVNASRDVWEAAVAPSLNTRQLYVNGVRAELAMGELPVSVRETNEGYLASSNTLAHWADVGGAELGWIGQMGKWSTQTCPIARATGRRIWMREPCWANTQRHEEDLVTSCCLGTPDFIENARELLTEPGQFYLDRTHNLIYYEPRLGQDMTDADVEAPVLQSLIRGRGRAAATFQNVEFSGLEFAYATWLQPGSSSGFAEVQAGYTLTGPHGTREGLCHLAQRGTCPYGSWTPEPGAVSLVFDKNIAFVDDIFVHLGAAALRLGDGSQGDTVSGSVFTDISGNGIELGRVDEPSASGGAQTRSDSITENHLFGFPTEFYGGVPILIGYAARCLVSHNQIDHVSYSAISIGWGGWLDKIGQPSLANYSRRNVISDNLIFDYLNTLSDGAGIYTLGITGTSMKNGERVTGNVIYDQLDWGRALQSDDGGTFITYEDNVVYGTAYAWDCSHLPKCYSQRVDHNYWQQTYPNKSRGPIAASANTVIATSADAPSSLVADAGLMPVYRSILTWTDGSQSPPGQPTRVFIFDASGDSASVTWQPPVAEGSSPVTSYTVQACQYGTSDCRSASTTVSVPADEFEKKGYVTLNGLQAGQRYRFTVTAANGYGSGTPSIQVPANAGAMHGRKPRHVKGTRYQAGPGIVALAWYPPLTGVENPILAYTVTCSNGQTQTVAGAGQLLPQNQGSRLNAVFGGLAAGTKYTFTITPRTLAGPGPSVSVGPLSPMA